MYQEDTIAAIATPPGEGGIAVVRISGPAAEKIVREIFSRRHRSNGTLRSHTLYHGQINDPKDTQPIDEVLLTIMRKPHSYTGEDVVEVHCHGGNFLVRQILALILSQGARQAEPGEFTKRAFLNGRIDLAQAEAVLDLIRARTVQGAQLALNQAGGELSRCVGQLREELLDILVQLEAAIDFPEEEIELLQRHHLIAKINALIDNINVISASYDWGRLFREGAKVCICGRPNVGKSSLMNALLGTDRVIVTPIPGTTRDVIEESLNLDGLPVIIWDTAGLRDSADQVEQIGVALSRRYLEQADALVVVIDGSVELTPEDQTLLLIAESKKVVIALNKSDLPSVVELQSLTADRSTRVLTTSAKTGTGIDSLKQTLRELILGYVTESPVTVTNLRHRSELQRSTAGLARAVNTLNQGLPPELAAIDLTDAREALEEIIGAVTNDEILERIFTNFCIGK
ncbi:MAG TPA: tRNA uridine-5-carboxymethylaminomethyl(34) synthesis GTPase MnmE [Candidatus Binatia bacterium]